MNTENSLSSDLESSLSYPEDRNDPETLAMIEMEENSLNHESTTVQTGGGSFQIDQFLMNALANPRDRLTILKLDSDLEKFIQNPKQTRLQFPSQSSYQRLIIHRVAQYFQLEHIVSEHEPGKRSVVLQKTPNSRVPVVRFSDLVEQPEAPPTSNKSFKIMRRGNHSQHSSQSDRSNNNNNNQITREHNNSNASHSNDNARKNPNASNNTEGLAIHYRNRQPFGPGMTLEEREEEYAKARARIFGPEAESGEQDIAENSSDALMNQNLSNASFSTGGNNLDLSMSFSQSLSLDPPKNQSNIKSNNNSNTSVPSLRKVEPLEESKAQPTNQKSSPRGSLNAGQNTSVNSSAKFNPMVASSTTNNNQGGYARQPSNNAPFGNYSQTPLIPLVGPYFTGAETVGNSFGNTSSPWGNGKTYEGIPLFSPPVPFYNNRAFPSTFSPYGFPPLPSVDNNNNNNEGNQSYKSGNRNNNYSVDHKPSKSSSFSTTEKHNNQGLDHTESEVNSNAFFSNKNPSDAQNYWNKTINGSGVKKSSSGPSTPSFNSNTRQPQNLNYFPQGGRGPTNQSSEKGQNTNQPNNSGWPMYTSSPSNNSFRGNNNPGMILGGFQVQTTPGPGFGLPILAHPPYYVSSIGNPAMQPSQMNSGHSNVGPGTIYISADEYQRRPPKPSASLFDPNAPSETKSKAQNQGHSIISQGISSNNNSNNSPSTYPFQSFGSSESLFGGKSGGWKLNGEESEVSQHSSADGEQVTPATFKPPVETIPTVLIPTELSHILQVVHSDSELNQRAIDDLRGMGASIKNIDPRTTIAIFKSANSAFSALTRANEDPNSSFRLRPWKVTLTSASIVPVVNDEVNNSALSLVEPIVLQQQ
eukprot:TRINITY_DN5063_c0_g2_i2.p1 TRINITY_DN5063_c0_g2~~TRINITY_DN5063_c0_g2_i2.p1  ORF type:complete len:867 (-),score=327.89 TRINITY_DN5063_c0_g2_i2:39-2639(-)